MEILGVAFPWLLCLPGLPRGAVVAAVAAAVSPTRELSV